MDSVFPYVLIAVLVGALTFVLTYLYLDRRANSHVRTVQEEANRIREEAESFRRDAELASKDEAIRLRADLDRELTQRRKEVERIERRVEQKEETIDQKSVRIDSSAGMSSALETVGRPDSSLPLATCFCGTAPNDLPV